MKQQYTPEEIESILNSTKNMQRAEMPAFFHTRLLARIENETTVPSPAFTWLLKPAVSLVALSLLLVLNIAAIRYVRQNRNVQTSATNPAGSFAEEYNLGTTTLYNAKSDTE
jgi:hypothetical protein